MKAAYVDSSCLVAIALNEPGSGDLAASLEGFDRLLTSNLLEAEFRSALAREGVAANTGADLLTWITWVLPDRPLHDEITRVLTTANTRGADLWHLASALYLVEDPSDLAFYTLDQQQRGAAEQLGFVCPT
jgi:predicted nucleic acid-binding protein